MAILSARVIVITIKFCLRAKLILLHCKVIYFRGCTNFCCDSKLIPKASFVLSSQAKITTLNHLEFLFMICSSS